MEAMGLTSKSNGILIIKDKSCNQNYWTTKKKMIRKQQEVKKKIYIY